MFPFYMFNHVFRDERFPENSKFLRYLQANAKILMANVKKQVWLAMVMFL